MMDVASQAFLHDTKDNISQCGWGLKEKVNFTEFKYNIEYPYVYILLFLNVLSSSYYLLYFSPAGFASTYRPNCKFLIQQIFLYYLSCIMSVSHGTLGPRAVDSQVQ